MPHRLSFGVTIEGGEVFVDDNGVSVHTDLVVSEFVGMMVMIREYMSENLNVVAQGLRKSPINPLE